MVSYYQSLIGVTWMIKLDHVDTVKISIFLFHNALPHEGHFEDLLHVMGYLK